MTRYTRPDPTKPHILDVEGVTVVIGGRGVLEDVSFWIPRGEFVCLCGPNGAGKSTLLKAILGIIEPSSGRITKHGSIGYVPQRKTFARDFPATAVELIVAAQRGKWPVRVKAAEREKARAVLERVGGSSLIDKPLNGLSGGETQRVFLARALVNNPSLLILDEPTAGVDVKGRAEFLDLLAEISASDELAAILVTHNIAAVSRTAERIVYLEAGRLIAWGLPGELLGQESLTALAFRTQDHVAPLAPDED